jgi:exodeoxyribonuclease V beta subunit
VYSFSQLAREASGIETRAADDEPEPAPLARTRFSGSRYGNALHDALELVDFAAWRDHRGTLPPAGQVAPLADALRAAGFASDADQLEGVPVLTALVSETLNAAMPEGARLATVPPAARLAEMEFHLALAPLRVDALLALLQAHGLVAERRTFGLRQRIEGLLTGRIDLVYEHAGRYYVLDYKSNQLPAYDEAALARAVRESEYDLQYVLYTLALHRWLRFRLGADYDIHRHLGGVRYLFSRGLSRDDASRPGVHALTLDPALVESLDALCRGESP